MDEKKPLLNEENNETVSAVETSEVNQENVVATVEAAENQSKPTVLAEEDSPAELADSQEETQAETNAPNSSATPVLKSKAEVLARLAEIADKEEQVERAVLENLKQVFYRFHNAEVAAAREAFVEAGGAEKDFAPAPDADEETFKAEMTRIKEFRAKAAEEQEKTQKNNLEEKEAIIVRIKEMNVSADVADKSYKEFKELQTRWKEIGEVPAEHANDIWKSYQQQVETFYDLLRLNYEFRNYDFKKNLEIKTALCEAAERLADVEDPISAFHSLQQLHHQYREAGPVAKELREEVWTRFKAASTVINKRHQAHFEQLKAQEEENLAKKTALCERVEAIDTTTFKNATAWEKATKEVTDMQAEWKVIGFTPRKVNTKIFERFRAACDVFFNAKSEFFKSQRTEWADNLAKKTALCEEAEALKDSTDWGKTTNKIIDLQRKWKEVGPVARRVSEQVWKRFNGACNAFFEKKNEATGSQRKEEQDNLEKKNDIIAQLEKLLADGVEDAREKMQELMAQWNAIGHVPFRKKEDIYKRYHDALDRLRTEFHISAGRRSVDKFRRNIAEKAGTPLERELARLKQLLESKCEEIKNYETNLSFFTSKSKSGNALVDGLQKNIERLKTDLSVVEEKIKVVKEQILKGEQPATVEEAPQASDIEEEEVLPAVTESATPVEESEPAVKEEKVEKPEDSETKALEEVAE